MTYDEKIVNRVLITQRQMGNLSGSISFYLRTPAEDVAKLDALMNHIKCDLGDLLLQTKLLIKDMGLSENEILDLAYQRHDECKKEFQSKGKSQYFV